MKFSNFTFFIMDDGRVKCCGRNSSGQLGLGYTVNQISTVTELSLSGVKNIVCGSDYTFFMMNDGSVKCCGNNVYGQLGLGHRTNPVSTVTDLPFSGVKNIVCGGASTFFMMNDGSVKCCGHNAFGQLGLGHKANPVSRVTDLPLTGVQDIVCGYYHTFFIMNNGSIKCCGYNAFGQLGLGHKNTSVSTVTGLPFSGVKDIACGSHYTFFMMDNGSAKCCGCNSHGQLGFGYTNSSVIMVTDLPLRNVKNIVCGYYHTFFIMNDGSVKCCGHNGHGQSGLGHKNTPVSMVTDLPLNGVKSIVCGFYYTFFMMDNGSIKCCGNNSNGQLGLGHRNHPVTIVTDLPFTGVAYFSGSRSVLIALYLMRVGSQYKTYDNGWIDVSVSGEADVKKHGMDTLPSFNIIDQLNQPELVAWIYDTSEHVLEYTCNDTEVYYGVYINNELYTRTLGAWEVIQLSELYAKGMTKAQLESVTPGEWAGIFTKGTVTPVVCMKTNDKNATPWLRQIDIGLPESFTTGDTVVLTGQNQFNTLDWERITGIGITQETLADTDIRYAFSKNNRQTWEIYRNGLWQAIPLDAATDGMTKEEVEDMPQAARDYLLDSSCDRLDVLSCLINPDDGVTPSIDRITFAYDQIETPLYGNHIKVPVPETGFRNVLVNERYTLKLAEGLAFDDAATDYDFYTTPDKIRMRFLEVGTVIGGHTSPVYAAEVINGYEDMDFHITLRAAKGSEPAIEGDHCALLPDAAADHEKTKVELSLSGEETFAPAYPLQFNLGRGAKRVFYIRMKPTLTTAGHETFSIILSGRPQ